MMIRLFKHFVPAQILFLALVDVCVLFGSMYIGVAIRFAGNPAAAVEDILPIFPKALVFAFVMLSVMTAFGLYVRDVPRKNLAFYGRFIGSFLIGLVAMAMVFYLVPHIFLGRGAFGLAVAVAFVGTALNRLIFVRIVDNDVLKRHILVVGTGSRAAAVKHLLDQSAELRAKFTLVGYVSVGENGQHYVDESLLLKCNEPLLATAVKHEVDEIIVGVRDRRGCKGLMGELLECKLEGISIVDLVSFFERETGHVQLDSLNPSWMVYSDGFSKSSARNVSKRIFDLVAASLLLFVTAPIMLLTAAMVVLESGFPIFYRQERVGECGHTFQVFKFRSMRQDAEKAGSPQWAKKNDSRVTWVGRFIRKVRIDELPQIFNVLRGDMSFVGPRPERPYFVHELSRKIPYYASRHAVKPGITGWAQIRYPYGASLEDAIHKLQYDLYYAKNHTFFLDLIVLLQTAQVVLFGKGAR